MTHHKEIMDRAVKQWPGAEVSVQPYLAEDHHYSLHLPTMPRRQFGLNVAAVQGLLDRINPAVQPAKAIYCDIFHPGKGSRGLKAEIWVVWSDGSIECPLDYYDDELRFHPSEILGHDRDTIIRLFHLKDVAYLQS